MNLREVLGLDVLQRGGVRVVAGEDLERPVRWAHSGEIADIAQFLSGGEVLLTAATGLARPGQDRRRYVRELAQAGVAAVIVELGRAFAEMPPEMIEEAREHDLVLVELEHEVPFVAVTLAVHTAIVEEHHATLARAIEIGDAVGQLVLDGAGLNRMLDVLAERLGNPVVLEDGSRHVVAVGRASSPTTGLLSAWHRHSREGHRQEHAASVERASSTPDCVWTSIVLNCEVWGRMHVLEVDSPLDEVAPLALGRAAASIALHLHAERDAARLHEAAEAALVGELARGADFSGEAFAARATGLGVGLEEDLVVLVAGGGSDGTDDGVLADHVTSVREAMRELAWPSLVASLDGHVVAVASARTPHGLETDAADLMARLRPHGLDHAGMSRPNKAQCLPRAFGEAEVAHRIGRVQDDRATHRYEELVLFRLLAPLLRGPELASFVESEIGPLLAFDARRPAELVKTLDAYLRCNGSKTEAARLLHLQRRSIYHRLDRIATLLGRSLEDADERARLYLALRANELLGVRSGPAVDARQAVAGTRDGRTASSGRRTSAKRPRVTQPLLGTSS